MLYFCPQSQAFYDSEIHTTLPDHAIAIDAAQHAQLLNALNGGCVIWVDSKQQIHISSLPPDAYHVWDDVAHTWTLPEAQAAQQLSDAKTAKLAIVNAAAQSLIAQVAHLDQTPDFEVRTWVNQANEAKAWAADPAAPTPTLDTIAAARGVPAELLKQKALEKAIAFEKLTATVAGLRQAIEDQINAANTLDALAAIDTAIRLPEATA